MSGRLLDTCPRCARAIPPDQAGLVCKEDHGRVVSWAAWCSGCERFWIIIERHRGRSRAVRFTAPRPATRVEASIAHGRLFRVRGLAAPCE